MKNPMQLKAIVKNIAKEKNISAKQIRGYVFLYKQNDSPAKKYEFN